MSGQEISAVSFWVAVVLIFIILSAIFGLIVRIWRLVNNACKDAETQQMAMAAQLKQMQGTLSESLGELRRANRLTIEQLELKRAEMTGDFEIVEEPIVPAPVARQSEEKTAHLPGNVPKSFPQL